MTPKLEGFPEQFRQNIIDADKQAGSTKKGEKKDRTKEEFEEISVLFQCVRKNNPEEFLGNLKKLVKKIPTDNESLRVLERKFIDLGDIIMRKKGSEWEKIYERLGREAIKIGNKLDQEEEKELLEEIKEVSILRECVSKNDPERFKKVFEIFIKKIPGNPIYLNPATVFVSDLEKEIKKRFPGDSKWEEIDNWANGEAGKTEQDQGERRPPRKSSIYSAGGPGRRIREERRRRDN